MATRSGLVAIIGRPNVGKSTLLNRLVGEKISITSHRPQTTRHRILGVKTADNYQIVYIDTPGLHQVDNKLINRYMNRAASGSLVGVDCIIMMITAKGWLQEDKRILERIKEQQTPVILVINKIDTVSDRKQLLPLIQESSTDAKVPFAEIIPLSASTGENVDELENVLPGYLPQQPLLFPEDQVTDRGARFRAAELIREQIFNAVGQEIPYAVAVDIETFKREKKILNIHAVVWVEKEGQKAILIGKHGEKLKTIGSRARREMEALFDSRVNLKLWVKVRVNWRDNQRTLRHLGFFDE